MKKKKTSDGDDEIKSDGFPDKSKAKKEFGKTFMNGGSRFARFKATPEASFSTIFDTPLNGEIINRGSIEFKVGT